MTNFSKMALVALSTSTLLSAGAIAAAPQAQTAGAAQPARSAKDYKLTKEVRQLVASAQTKTAAGDHTGAQTDLQAALPLNKTPDDRYITGNVMVDVGAKLKSAQLQQQGVDLMASSGVATGVELARLQFFQGRFAFVAGDYPKALSLFQTAKAGGYTEEPQLNALIADAAFKSNNTGQGLATLRQLVEADVAAGRKPDENFLKRGVSVAYQSKQADQLAWWTQQQVRAYPTPQNWRTALITYRDGANLDTQAQLDLMRLQRATRSLQGERDFYEYASSATDRGLPAEVVAVLDEGRSSGAVDVKKASIAELYKLAQGKVAADRTSLAREETSAEKSTAARDAMAVADAYLGYKDYAKAAKFYQLALARSGVDVGAANTRLGIALALSGQKAPAKEAFAKVTGPREGIADYWEVYLDQTA